MCLSTCVTCTNAITCASCSSSLHRVLNSSNLCECQSGYYLSSSGVCLACDSLCSTCTKATTCTICKVGLYRIMNSTTSLCTCKTSYVLNTTSNLCMGCQYSCQSCVTGHDDQCSTCNTTAFRLYTAGTRQCECKVGYYDDGSNVLCLPCSYSCKSCSGTAETCTACPSGTERVYDGSGNTCKCAQHFYDQMAVFVQSEICKPCAYHCSSCDDPSSCLTCNSTNHRQKDALNVTCICGEGFFDDSTRKEMCLACPYQCLTCTNSSSCLKCKTTNHRAIPASLCPCINNYYDTNTSNSLCSPCHYSCKTCLTGAVCVSCELGYSRIFNLSTNVCSCLGRFFDPGQQTCSSCGYSCLTCITNPLNCLTCNSTALRTLNSSLCLCNEGYFDQAVEQCMQCQYSCKTCGNERSCLSCNPANMREYDLPSGLCTCMTSYYDNETSS